jgi:DNA processing protein
MEQSDKRRRMYLRLTLADGVGAITIRRLAEHFGDIEAAVTAPAEQLRQVEGVGEKTAAAIAAVDESAVDEELALADKNGATVLCVEDAAYPAALKNIYDPPPVLYVRGEITESDAVALGVVGSRRCTHYGLEQADRFGGLLGRAGFTVISGGARGIDTAAHRGALTAGGRTIAVMGCGLCDTYPRENKKLFDKIVSDGRGAVISELPMRIGIKGANFPRRNRIISGLSLGVLIVEAARRSGSLITARSALEQSKEVFALPGRVDSPFSAGTNSLIAAGSAALVQNIEDILDGLDRVGEVLAGEGAAEPVARKVNLTETESVLLEHLRAAELSLDELIRRSGLSSPETTAAMTMLAIKGMVAQKPGGVFAARSARG